MTINFIISSVFDIINKEAIGKKLRTGDMYLQGFWESGKEDTIICFGCGTDRRPLLAAKNFSENKHLAQSSVK